MPYAFKKNTQRCKNFTNREKLLLTEIVKGFSHIIHNKKTDAITVEKKHEAWDSIVSKYNALSETGPRTSKQLHALYDNLKKSTKRNTSDDKCETFKTGDETFLSNSSIVDENESLSNHCTDITITSSPPEVYSLNTDVVMHKQSSPSPPQPSVCNLPQPSQLEDCNSVSYTTPKKQMTLTEKKNRVMDAITTSIMKRKHSKQANEDVLMEKKVELLNLQIEHEKLRIEQTVQLFHYDLKLKLCSLESATFDLELKKRKLNIL